MSVTYCEGDVFLSDAQTLAHGCNTIGMMGAGIAIAFKKKFPQMFYRYKNKCSCKEFRPGWAYVDKECDPWVLNLATQSGIRGAKMSFIKETFKWIAENYEKQEITSIAMPMIGAGYGKIDRDSVKKVIDEILNPLPIPVFVYETCIIGVKGNEKNNSS